MLAHFRCSDTCARLAIGFAIGVATVCRYVYEAVEVLAALIPALEDAVRIAARKAFVTLDGTSLRMNYSTTRITDTVKAVLPLHHATTT
ncbi:hypothetical protein GCM10020221_28520 [Streptomyces thioluteus]|uniref:Transposase Helix-turn-helix domain-containing protein n=1 Tax=Streptomyces thioluteus TaxID=66431 RepID=A0ABP6JEZ2_STRTU